MRFCLSVISLFLAFGLASCARHELEDAPLITCNMVAANLAQIESFSNGLKAELAAEGFTPFDPSELAKRGDGFWFTRASREPSVVYFKGSYQNSPVFYLRILHSESDPKNSPHDATFHLEYEWRAGAYPSHRKEMHEKVLALRAVLSDWMKKDKDVDGVGGGPEFSDSTRNFY